MNRIEKYQTDWRAVLLASQEPYTREFQARVADRRGCWVALHETYFYPRLSAQPADYGTFSWDGRSHAQVVDVDVRDGLLWHLLSAWDESSLPSVGDTIHASIDWFRRYALMKAHTSAVLMAGLAKNRWGCDVSSCHISLDHVSLDYELQHLPSDDVHWLVSEANRAIEGGATVTYKWLTAKEAQENQRFYRSGASITRIGSRAARVVKIATESEVFEEQYDLGTHVKTLSELGRVVLGKRTAPGQAFRDDRGANAERVYFHTDL